jgi:hypothetical protein
VDLLNFHFTEAGCLSVIACCDEVLTKNKSETVEREKVLAKATASADLSMLMVETAMLDRLKNEKSWAEMTKIQMQSFLDSVKKNGPKPAVKS